MKPLRKHAGRALRLGLTALALAALSGGAFAQITSEQQSAIRANCRSDFMAKCKGVTPGGKDALVCLQKNVADLAPGCKTAVSATIPAPAPVPVASKPPEPPPAPAAPPPAAAPPTGSAPTAPPPPAQPAAAPPSPAAKPQQAQKPAPPPKPPAAAPKQTAAAPAAAPPPPPAPPAAAAPLPSEQQMKAVAFTCRREFADNCRGVQPGGAEAIDCLHRNAARLTPDCMTSLADLGDAMPPTTGPRPPVETRTPNAPLVMTAVIGRACMRDLLLHCRDVPVGDGRKIACLTERGPALAPLCRAALNITEPVR